MGIFYTIITLYEVTGHEEKAVFFTFNKASLFDDSISLFVTAYFL